jgi:CRP-like cAMP-binding protein
MTAIRVAGARARQTVLGGPTSARVRSSSAPAVTVGGGTVTEDAPLARAPLFAALDEEAAEALRSSMVRVALARGEVLFDEGEPGDRLYVIVDGKIKLGATSNDGRETLLAILGPGEMFGELSLFDPGPRTATATALTDAHLLGVGHPDLQPWLNGRPEVAGSLLRALAHRLRRTNGTMADLVFSDVPGRVAKALLDLAAKFGERNDDGSVHVVHDLTQEELAQLVGASRETVNKALADFQNRGWLRLEPRGVDLVDLERLSRRAQ